MIPQSFPQANCVLTRPQDMTDDQCSSLEVLRTHSFQGLPVVISLWQLTPEELEEVKRTGNLWIMVVGVTMPPIFPTGIQPPEIDKPPPVS